MALMLCEWQLPAHIKRLGDFRCGVHHREFDDKGLCITKVMVLLTSVHRLLAGKV